jgi:hypothetical protein
LGAQEATVGPEVMVPPRFSGTLQLPVLGTEVLVDGFAFGELFLVKK